MGVKGVTGEEKEGIQRHLRPNGVAGLQQVAWQVSSRWRGRSAADGMAGQQQVASQVSSRRGCNVGGPHLSFGTAAPSGHGLPIYSAGMRRPRQIDRRES